MNQAQRWKAFISWWDNYIPECGDDIYEIVQEKIDEIKQGKRKR